MASQRKRILARQTFSNMVLITASLLTPTERNTPNLEMGCITLIMASGKRPRNCSFLAKMGPIAEKGFYKAKLKQNLNTQGAIQITTPDNKILNLSVIGLRYYDAASGQIAS